MNKVYEINKKAILDSPEEVSEKKKHILYVVLISFCVGLAAQLWSFNEGLLVAYADAGSHLDLARRFYDSHSPGIVSQIGTVWLPIPHLLLLPFTYITPLWVSGFAGCITGLVYLIVSCSYIFLTIRLFSKSNLAAWLGMLLFLFNPNILYMYTTAMTEPVLIMFMISALYFLLKWTYTKSSFHLLMAGLLTAMAVGSRYEGWFFAVSLAGLLFISEIINKGKPFRTTRNFIILPAVFVLLWFAYNHFYQGDFLAFQRGEYSSQAQMLQFEETGRLPTKGDLGLSFFTFNSALITTCGIITVFIFISAFLFYLFRTRLRSYSLLPLALILIYPFSVLSLYLGQVMIELPSTLPSGYWNSRYGLILLPGMVFFMGYLFAWLLKRKELKFILPAIVLLQSTLWIHDFPESAPTIAEAKSLKLIKPQLRRVTEYFYENYKGGNILYDDLAISFFSGSGIPMNERIHNYTYKLKDAAVNKPSEFVEWILLNPGNPNDRIYPLIKDNSDFNKNFDLHYIDNDIYVYKRKNGLPQVIDIHEFIR